MHSTQLIFAVFSDRSRIARLLCIEYCLSRSYPSPPFDNI